MWIVHVLYSWKLTITRMTHATMPGMTVLWAVIGSLIGVIVGAYLTNRFAMQRFKEERAERLANLRREKFERISQTIVKVDTAFMDGTSAVFEDAPINHLFDVVPFPHIVELQILCRFYAPQLVEGVKQLQTLNRDYMDAMLVVSDKKRTDASRTASHKVMTGKADEARKVCFAMLDDLIALMQKTFPET